MKIRDILNAAADVIETRGWCQSSYRVGRRVCASRAIMVVLKMPLNKIVIYDRAEKAAAALCRHIRKRKLWEWNDAPKRTQQEVVAAFRAAAKKCKKEV